ncbi:MAG TPA: hypothetical protein VKT78_07170 [Fimbriimonadaceae bacterium]|nr:hypothetical protein [Fimbriimonadaceae bacterium]
MEARKLAGQMAAICPFALLIGMGYSARQQAFGQPILQYSEAQNRRLEAYRPIVSEALPPTSDATQIRHYADVWIHTADMNKLQALTPAYQEDMTEENARAEIISDWRWAVQSLNHFMRRELLEHEDSLAVEDATRLIRVCEIIKYSDFTTLRIANSNSSHAIPLIAPRLSGVSKADSEAFKAAAAATGANHSKLPAMYKVIKANYEDYQVRRITFGREAGTDMPSSPDDDITGYWLSNSNLQRVYVLAVRDEAKLRENERTLLGFGASRLKS